MTKTEDTRQRTTANKIFKWAGTVLGVLLLLPFFLMSLLYIPGIQNWAVQRAVGYASEATGMTIGLDRVNLTFLLDVELDNLTALQAQDTLLYTRSVVVDLDFSKILDKKIGVESVAIRQGQFNSMDMIPQTYIQARLGLLKLGREDTDLQLGIAHISSASLQDCDLDIRLRDTTIIDTTESSPIPWSILVDEISIDNSCVNFGTAGDTLTVGTHIRQARLRGGDINLETGVYQVRRLGLTVDTLLLSMMDTAGVHTDIPLSVTTLGADSLYMDTLGLNLGHVEMLTGKQDDVRSYIRGALGFDFTSFTVGGGGQFHADAQMSLEHTDLLSIAQAYIPRDIANVYPEKPLQAHLVATGNMDSLYISRLDVAMPASLDLSANGHLLNIMDEGSRQGNVALEANTMDLRFLLRYLGLKGIHLPGMQLSANAGFHGEAYHAQAQVQRGYGKVRMEAQADLGHMAYRADLSVDNVNVADFMPHDSIGRLSLNAHLSGHGTDFYSRATGLKGRVSLDKLEYKQWLLSNIHLGVLLKQGRASVDLLSQNELLDANACASVDINRKKSKADFSLALNKINFYALGLTADTLTASMDLSLNGNTDMKSNHSIDGRIHNMTLATSDSAFYPLDLDLEAMVNDSCMYAAASAGDLELKFTADDGLDSMLYKIDRFNREMQAQIAANRIAPDTLKVLLPTMNMHLACRKNNPLANTLRSFAGSTFNEMTFDLEATPHRGLNGRGYMNKLVTAGVRIDSISWYIRQDSNDIDMLARVKNGPRNKMVNFESILTASVSPGKLKSHLLFLDERRRKGIDLGFMAENTDTCTWVHLFPHNPILAYRKFNVNDKNYIAVDQANRIKADMHLIADDGTSLKLYSTPNEDAEQDVTLSIDKFDLGELSSVLPFMPMVTGMLNGDVHALQQDGQYTVSLDMDVKKMGFEGSPLGNIGMNMVYFPNADGTHLMDGYLSQDDREIVQLTGMYQAREGKESIVEAEALLKRLPLSMANGFVPDNILRLEGYISGLMRIEGSVGAPSMSGGMVTDSVHICSDPYSIDLRMPDDTVVIKNSYLNLDKIRAYANGNNPLTLDGTVDFRHLESVKLDLSVVARDFNLINAPKRKGAEAYGKVYADIYGRMRGTLDNLDIKGRLNINGRTNVTYVMKDSPLTVDDQLGSMVTFTDFLDTLEVEPVRMPEQNVKMDWQLHIDEATTIHCLLSEDGQDKIDLEGGGELRMTYDMLNGMRLFGRYTILSGRMDYSLVVVALKNFQIDSGSYVEFMGDMMNPKLSLSASERKKASVTTNNVSRSVNFDVGLKITQTLSDMGLEFTLEAPEDLSVRNELSAMSVEDRGRAAVTMLTTGMYISPNGGGGSNGFDATNALNSFLNSQISNIAGKALSTIDIGFGIDNTTNAAGANQTDYSFSFAKRFWGNRISIIIGGKVSSGNEVKNTGMSILNNVSIEYRLDNSGTRYVKAFYNKDTESLLDAEVMEMGASLVLRKKTENLGELFIFRDTKKKRQARMMKRDAGTAPGASQKAVRQ